jgi:glycosyltransferase involved in cell wall biosynthesis
MSSDAKVTPVVSVIIPAYNVAAYIDETIRSVLAQTYTSYEVILVNDGSPDTDEMEKAIEPYRDRIVYIKQENLGAGGARNEALKIASGEFVAFLDADDVWQPDFLSEMVPFVQSEGFDLVYANARLFGESAVAGLTYMDTNPSTGEVTCEALLAERCNIITSGVLARKKPILDLGLFDASLRHSQDFDLWVRMAKRPGARMAYLRKVLLRQRHRRGSLASDPIKSVEGELKVLEKVALRNDLTPGELDAMQRTIALRSASLEVDRGKRSLLEGQFDSAARSFRSANNYYDSWKLRLVLFWLRFAPRVVQQAYRLRNT